jgi:hypothetical protein
MHYHLGKPYLSCGSPEGGKLQEKLELPVFGFRSRIDQGANIGP